VTSLARHPSRRAIPNLRAAFGLHLRQLRVRRRWSQDFLGAKAGLSHKFIGEIERGEKSISRDNLAHLARALRVPLVAMLKGLKKRKGRPAGRGARSSASRVTRSRRAP
jgi:transcriptional regulator with XRE-family HTH domain